MNPHRLAHPHRRVLGVLGALCVMGAAQALELNRASEAELDGLRGMGPALNRQVRLARAQHAFTDWADFQARVAGVGAAKARAFSEQGLTVNGQPYRP